MSGAPREILVRATNWVGDAVLNTPVFRALKKNHPGARLTVVARPWVAEVFEGNPCVDRLVVERDRSRAGRRALVAELQTTSYDVGIALPNSWSAAWLLWRAGARERIGFALGGRSILLTRPVPVPAWLLDVHQINYYLYLLRDLCDDFRDARRLDLVLAEPHRAEADAALARFDERPAARAARGPLLALAPGAAFGTAKRWPPASYARLVATLADRDDARFVLVGSKGEAPVAAAILAALADFAPEAVPRVLDTCGRLSLKGTAALLARADHFFTNDSGAMHLAAALDVPTIALFGPTDWRTTAPFSALARIVRDPTECAPCLLRHCPIDHRCMAKLSPARVEAAWRQARRSPVAPLTSPAPAR